MIALSKDTRLALGLNIQREVAALEKDMTDNIYQVLRDSGNKISHTDSGINKLVQQAIDKTLAELDDFIRPLIVDSHADLDAWGASWAYGLPAGSVIGTWESSAKKGDYAWFSLNVPDRITCVIITDKIGKVSFEPEPDRARFPHTCPRCSGPAYIGMNDVDCARKC